MKRNFLLLTLCAFFLGTLSVMAQTMTITKTNGEKLVLNTSEVSRIEWADAAAPDPEPPLPSVDNLVDLGLSVRWATINIGATNPEDIGNYYAWGEKETKESYYQFNYFDSDDGCWNFKKYAKDKLTRLDLADDVAHEKWGGNWRMPTAYEMNELLRYCTWTKTTLNGVSGYKVTGPNGNHIFLPATGYFSSELKSSDKLYYFCSTISRTYNDRANCLKSLDNSSVTSDISRWEGCAVRAVYDDPIPTGTAIDLGLTVNWASYNVGARRQENFGLFYAWGETEVREYYTISTYFDYDNETSSYKKYSESKKTTLDPEDDVAHVKWGGTWRMPTKKEWEELYDKCEWTWTTLNGVNGYKVKGPNGNSIFLPASGYCLTGEEMIYRQQEFGYYWSRELYNDVFACDFYFISTHKNYSDNSNRQYGLSVRPVCPK